MIAQKNKRIDTELNQLICKYIKEDKTSNEISEIVGIPASTIRRAAKRNNLEIFVSQTRIRKSDHNLIITLISEQKNASEISKVLGCVDPETVRKFARNRNLNIVREDMSMDSHPSWKGGVTYDRSGYELTRTLCSGEFGYLIRALGAGRYSGYAPTHRIVMHQKIGRPLRKGEVVDHIDGDIHNNNSDNLRVFVSNAEHLRETLIGRVPQWTVDGFSRITGRPKNPHN